MPFESIDLLIRGATVLDGAGTPRFRADVAIRSDRIVALGDLAHRQAGRTIDAAGAMLAPGFIDLHSHSDRTLLVDPRAESKVRQGVTTEVIGNCGMSSAPLIGEALAEERQKLERYGLEPDWRTVAQYLHRLEEHGVGLNVVALVGHGTVRRAVMGHAMRPPDAGELATMRRLVDEAVRDGAAGLATGLIYPPGCYAATDEIVELARPVGERGGIYATHLRNEGVKLLEALAEAVAIGRGASVSVEVSHHKASGPRAWGLVRQSLARIEEANRQGLKVDFDQYPYTAASTGLSAVLPDWAHEGGAAALVERLRDPETRAKVAADVRARRATSFGEDLGWDQVLVADSRADRSFDGRTIAEIAAQRGADPVETIFDLLIANAGDVGCVFFTMCEEDVQTVMRHPLMMVGSDSAARAADGPLHEGKPHPRGYGTFPRILGRYVRELGVLTWEDAIRRMSGRPAAKLGLRERGTIRPGNFADLVLFDPLRVRDTATYADPHRYPEGIRAVIVNGRVALEDGQRNANLAGRVLRH